MKKFLLGLSVLICVSCSENGVKLGKPSSFVRYFNGGTPDVAQSIIKTKSTIKNGTVGGYLILANSQTDLTTTYYRIKLIRVDEYGNEIWQSLLPVPPKADPNAQTQPTAPNWRGFGITAITDNTGLDSGYFIVGEEIYDSLSGRTQALLMIQVNQEGATVNSVTVKPNQSKGIGAVRGIGVTPAQTNGHYYVLGQTIGASTDMFLAEIDGTTTSFNTVWTRNYGSVAITLVNKVFTYGDSIYWGGTRASSSSTPQEMRWVSSQINTSSQFDHTYPDGQVNSSGYYSCNDICNYGFDYGFVGSRGPSQNLFDHIAFFRVDKNGRQVDSASYLLKYPQPAPYETGNSICSTNDGGFLILGTTATDISTSDTNYLLIKTDSHGALQWKKEYGGRFIDVGAKVLQADDGGFIVLGTTTLANVQSIFLMKTDSNGGIE